MSDQTGTQQPSFLEALIKWVVDNKKSILVDMTSGGIFLGFSWMLGKILGSVKGRLQNFLEDRQGRAARFFRAVIGPKKITEVSTKEFTELFQAIVEQVAKENSAEILKSLDTQEEMLGSVGDQLTSLWSLIEGGMQELKIKQAQEMKQLIDLIMEIRQEIKCDNETVMTTILEFSHSTKRAFEQLAVFIHEEFTDLNETVGELGGKIDQIDERLRRIEEILRFQISYDEGWQGLFLGRIREIHRYNELLDTTIDFVGRENEIRIGLEFLLSESKSVLLITGQPGIGKTELMYEIVRRVLTKFDIYILRRLGSVTMADYEETDLRRK